MHMLFLLFVITEPVVWRMSDLGTDTLHRCNATRDSTAQDTATFDVVGFLASRQYRIEGALPSCPPLYPAIVAGREVGEIRSIVIVRAATRSPFVMAPTLPIGVFTPHEFEWVVSGNRPTSGPALLRLTFDDPFEGAVGTALYEVASDSLRTVFRDQPDACQPATFADIDDDGSLEFLVHSESPAEEDCSDSCALVVRERFGVEPGWVTVHRWEGGRLVAAERGFSAFYRGLGATYQRIHDWLGGEEASGRCRSAQWLARDTGMFLRWAQRATALADPSDLR